MVEIEETLAHPRHVKYKEATHIDNIDPESLPPTERTVFFHSLRVHLQVSQWKLNFKSLKPIDLGLKREKNMSPVKTDLNPAPENILQSVCCNSKLTLKKPCTTRLRSCRKNGLSCVPATKTATRSIVKILKSHQ